MIAQNALPVIEDPWMRLVPWPIQTAPVNTRRAPTTRLAMTTKGHYVRSQSLVCRVPRGGADFDITPHTAASDT
jgi:hypothetical protein